MEIKESTKENVLIVALVLLIAMLSLIIYKIVTKEEIKEETGENTLTHAFYVKTPVDSYSLTSSAYKGMPFEIVCDSKEEIVIIVSAGELADKEMSDGVYTAKCGDTIYWSPLNDANLEIANITIQSPYDDIKDAKYVIVNDNNNYIFN